MKIAINTCFGGFGLSTKALLWLVEKNSELIEKHENGSYRLSPYSGQKEEFVGNGLYSFNSWELHTKDRQTVYTTNSRDEEYRNHPDLIEVIETLGNEANGECADLSIVEIPDGIDWEIDEYDGNETIEEKHRSWR